jgi:DNA-binding GntR family transcriptional regulator
MIEPSSSIPFGTALGTIQKSAAPLRKQVLDELRQSIISGRLAPGSRLVERELISMMGVSRTVIREALRQLESEGLIAMVANKGPIVRELTVAEAEDLYAIRAVLEGLAARLFAEKARPDQIELLEKSLVHAAEAYATDDPEQSVEAKNHFYEVLFEGAGSETLSQMINTLHGRIWRWRALGLSHPQRSASRWKESIQNLGNMIAAIKRKDAANAEEILRDEVGKAAAEVNKLLARSDTSSARLAQ